MRKNAISLRVIVPIVLVLTLVSFVLRTFLGYALRMTADDAARWSLWVTIVLGSVTLPRRNSDCRLAERQPEQE